MGPWGPSEFCPYGTTGTPNAWSLRRPPIPMGSRGPPEPPFHGDPPNLIPTGPWGPPEPPLLQQQGLCVLSPWTAGHRPCQAQGTPCPHTDGLGGPRGVPTLRGDPPCPSRGRGAPSLLSLPAPAGRQRRAGHGDTRGRCHFRAGCANTASADLRPLTHTRAPHKGRVQEGPPKPSSPSPHCFPPPNALFSLSPKSHCILSQV